MRQVESVCVRATDPVHSALAAWVALLAHAGLRGEDSQRMKLYHVVLQTLRFMVFAGTLNLEVSQTCLGRHCVAVYWIKTGGSMRGTTSW